MRNKQQQMLQALTLDFPFFLNLLQSQLKTGRSIYQSIEKIDLCLQPSPLKNMLLDFKTLSNTIPSLNIVTHKIYARYPNKYVLSFCNILIDSIQHGTPIVESLQSFANDVENQIYLDAEQQIQKTPVKLLAPLMLCIFPVTFIIIFMPIILSFIQ
ncbi:MAG TPA: type II secretion system F family protein [Oligoflexia bacterium]|nr:type II secretion system F family protein [Oligoflexia bacterium]HMR25418.1 type II secretion system F family protein [Oligoflexia bacterium]